MTPYFGPDPSVRRPNPTATPASQSENGEPPSALGVKLPAVLDFDVCYQAMLARDRRFDGRFFVAVQTTGIYCRPICPARPKRENVRFYPDRGSAERAGYRACRRCRPDALPMTAAWQGSSAVVRRAVRLISSGAFEEERSDEDAFAAKFGATARHLRRLFRAEIGATPRQLAEMRRLNLARSLAAESRLPIESVAYAVGFRSLRRFNDAFQKRFGKPPSAFRSNSDREAGPSAPYELALPFQSPLDWDSLVGFFRSHRIPGGSEEAEGGRYLRAFRIGINNESLYCGGSMGAAEASLDLERSRLLLRVWTSEPRALLDVVARARRMFDLDANPEVISAVLCEREPLRRLHGARPGLRIPRGWDPFETAICAILGQFVSVERAGQLIGQLVESCGEQAVHPATGARIKLFPSAETLTDASLTEIKTTGARKATVREVARRALNGTLSFSEAQDPEAFKRSLLEIKGIGPWSAEYISLRALGDSDAFPGTDLILKRALELHPELDLERARPWRAYAALHLWREYAGSLSRPKRTPRSPKQAAEPRNARRKDAASQA